MEIVKEGLITTPSNSEAVQYRYILKLIRNGKLRATNYAIGKKRASFFILGRDIAEYIRENWNIDLVKDGKKIN